MSATIAASKPRTRHRLRQRRERFLLVVTVLAVLAAWFYGYFTSSVELAPLVPQVLQGASRIQTRGELFIGFDPQGEIIGYAATGEAQGYSGPILVLVGIDPAGEVTGVKLVNQRETPGFFRLVLNSDLLSQMPGKQVVEPFRIGEDLDAVTGATLSAEGLAASARQAIRQVTAEGLDRQLPPEDQSIKFGIPEITLILLFAAGYFGHQLHHPAWKQRIRWATLLAGMLVLGFVYTTPFTITMVVSLLSGYWPDWHNNLYWYLLIGGILFVTTVNAKNPYCSWFCPFGAVQECLAAVTGAKLYRPRNYHIVLTWLQRGLALVAVILGLALRRPGVIGYEPFATLFDFQGAMIEWLFLVLILFASLLILRPFCNYLCPLDPVVDLIAVTRKWAREVWQKWTQRRAIT